MKELHAAFAKALGKKKDAPAMSPKSSTCYACGGMVGEDGHAAGGEIEPDGDEGAAPESEEETKTSKARGFLLALKGK